MTRDEQGNYTITPDEALALWEATYFFLVWAEVSEDLEDPSGLIAEIDGVFTRDLGEEVTVEQAS